MNHRRQATKSHDAERAAYRDLFFAEACRQVAEIASVRHGPGTDDPRVTRALRAAHTLKANAAAMEFPRLAQLSHELESRLLEPPAARAPQQGGLRDAIRRLVREARRSRDGAPTDAGSDVDLPPVPQRSSPQVSVPPSSERSAWVQVQISEDCRMPAARGMLLLARARTVSRKVQVVPSPDLWTAPDFDRTIAFGVAPSRLDALADALGSEPEICSVQIAPIGGVRDVALAPWFARLSRLVSDLAEKTGKRFEFFAESDQTALPRPIFAALSDAVVHLVRNAADHGIEAPELRRRLGKSEIGQIRLELRRVSGWLEATLSDDGHGLDREAIRRRAAQVGVAPSVEATKLVFMDGFSTRDTVNDLSGRGIGLAAVRERVESLGGSVAIASESGRGTSMTIRVPLPPAARAA